MLDFKVCIPSKGRAGQITSLKIFKDATLYVPKAEYEQYKKVYKNTTITQVPDSIKGITATRNYILKTNDCNIFFLDDDLEYGGYFERQQESYKVIRVYDKDIYYKELQKMFEVAYQIGSKVIGLFTVGNNLTNYANNPFLFNGVCLGSCMGVINDGTYYFNEEFEVKEDYELTLRILKEGGVTVRSNILFMQHEHTKLSGGCRDSRRIDKEKRAILKLISIYPGMIKSAQHRGTSFSIQLNY